MKFANRILRALDAGTIDALSPWLEPVAIRADQVIYRMSEPVEHVYFIESGLVMHLAIIEDGRTVSVGVTGREGAVGVPNALGGRPSFHQVSGHVEGAALRIEAARFSEIVNASRSARKLIDAYLETLIVASDLMTTCLAFHPLSARLSTALLNAQDANGNHKVLATQELLASMFAVQRTSVTSLATSMERSGLIRTGRGAVEILDRSGLERSACGCYGRQTKLWSDFWADLGEER
jgi:CRP-like cAMP-binding protein